MNGQYLQQIKELSEELNRVSKMNQELEMENEILRNSSVNNLTRYSPPFNNSNNRSQEQL